jgi:hypothetical protein
MGALVLQDENNHHHHHHHLPKRVLRLTAPSQPYSPRRTWQLEFCQMIPFFRNQDLVDRRAIFSELDRLLPVSSEGQSAALWGLGGSG